MPWVREDMCTGCQTCVGECCVGAISMREGVAFIDNGKCIRCGICHEVCPVDAVRHDSELIPEEVESNLEWVNELLAHSYYWEDEGKQQGLLKRLERHFVKERKVADQTVERIRDLLS